MFLQPCVKAKKGFKLECRNEISSCVINGYLDSSTVCVYKNERTIVIRLKQAIAICNNNGHITNKNVYKITAYCNFSSKTTIHCCGYWNLNQIKYTIYPSKQEINAKLTNTTKLSKNIINKIINL